MAEGVLSFGIRPFDRGKDKPVKNPDGSYSTERTRTVPIDGWWVNVPSLWFDEATGSPVDLRHYSDEELASIARKSGRKFPSFKTVPEAVQSAKERSERGGAMSNPMWVQPMAIPRRAVGGR